MLPRGVEVVVAGGEYEKVDDQIESGADSPLDLHLHHVYSLVWQPCDALVREINRDSWLLKTAIVDFPGRQTRALDGSPHHGRDLFIRSLWRDHSPWRQFLTHDGVMLSFL